MKPTDWVDGLIASIRQIITMRGANRHIHHTRKLAELLGRRAQWRKDTCAFYKASLDQLHAKALDAACDYIEGKAESTEAEK